MSNTDSTISSYDLVPYESYPFAHLHPARLAATAQLRGFSPPPVTQARVLDIGCGSGGHVVALAAFYPRMQLIGVDLAVGQIARGNARIEAMGLTNVSLHAGDLGAGLPASALQAAQAFGGQFDYILCQGVYYVVPDAVRDAIWRLIDTHLAPSGIAHLSFNTYPGWKQREVAQDFAQFHAPTANDRSGQPSGAAQELADALVVNPYDVEEASWAMERAALMPPAEQAERMRALRAVVAEHNVYRWAGRMLLDAAQLRMRARRTLNLSELSIPIGS